MSIPTIDMVATGKNIRMMRKHKGLSVKDIQKICGFGTVQAIYKWEQGVSLPTIDNLVVLAAVFESSIDAILVLN